MLKILLAIPPIISMAHVFIAIFLFLVGFKYSGNLLILFGLPVTLVIFIHIYLAISDNSMTKSEHLGYALVHIPFSIVFSFLSLLLFIPNNEKIDIVIENQDTLLQCIDKKEVGCLNNFIYTR
jgi:hypothetical protein